MRQLTLEDRGTPLFSATFVALDLETTGASPASDSITEIGALKATGGQVIGTFHTLIRPDSPIPASIRLLTGIDDSMVAGAPPIEAVLGSLFEFLSGAVLVAHNATFDSSFLKGAFTRHGYEVPFRRSVCTLAMARRLMRGETSDLRLQSLASSLGVATVPTHRAFPDAKATLEVFHRLLELAGPLGVLTCEDLFSFCRGTSPRLSKLGLAANIPHGPGAYRFLDPAGRVLYVGKAADLRPRVRSYFYGDERSKIAGLLRQVARIEAERTPTLVAAEILEARLIDQHLPPYNRRGRRRTSPAWVKLAPGPIPRLVATRAGGSGCLLGPFPSRSAALAVVEAIEAAAPVARCADPRRHPAGCAFAGVGRCAAPCLPEGRPAYAGLVNALAAELAEGGLGLLRALQDKMHRYSDQRRYEEAAATRDRVAILARAIQRASIASAWLRAGRVVVCQPAPDGIQCVAVDHGRFAGSWLSRDPPDGSKLREVFEHASSASSTLGTLSPTGLDEMLILWRDLGRATHAGGWIAWCDQELSVASSYRDLAALAAIKPAARRA